METIYNGFNIKIHQWKDTFGYEISNAKTGFVITTCPADYHISENAVSAAKGAIDSIVQGVVDPLSKEITYLKEKLATAQQVIDKQTDALKAILSTCQKYMAESDFTGDDYLAVEKAENLLK